MKSQARSQEASTKVLHWRCDEMMVVAPHFFINSVKYLGSILIEYTLFTAALYIPTSLVKTKVHFIMEVYLLLYIVLSQACFFCMKLQDLFFMYHIMTTPCVKFNIIVGNKNYVDHQSDSNGLCRSLSILCNQAALFLMKHSSEPYSIRPNWRMSIMSLIMVKETSEPSLDWRSRNQVYQVYSALLLTLPQLEALANISCTYSLYRTL